MSVPERDAEHVPDGAPDDMLAAQLSLKARLQRTWSPFFSRHGSFTESQLAAIPHILAGANILLCAPTASGKTEAVIAPLIERYLARPQLVDLTILYLTPTKALVNDLWARLSTPLEMMGLTSGIKTGDINTIKQGRLPTVLISTPESLDSLLTSRAKIFTNLKAVVLDELHLFDGTPRGDHLRVLLNRLRVLRTYAFRQGEAPNASLQFAALSASMPAPQATAERYFPAAHILTIPGARPVKAEIIDLAPDNADEMLAYFQVFRERGWRKALAFCNTRVEVETYATATHERSPFGNAVFVHYSNLEPKRRREIEQRFSAAESAICFASSTLELGIDIGSIDVILLIGAPGSNASFIQRIGRGNRRQKLIRAACFCRSPLEKLLFETLINAINKPFTNSSSSQFRRSVAIQQIFSLVKQSPTGTIRLATLSLVLDGMVEAHDLQDIIGELAFLGYLQPARAGEWGAGRLLHRLIEQQAARYSHSSLSLYSNIKSSDAPKIEIRDRHSHEMLARVDTQWLDRKVMTFEGRPVNIEWADGEAIWIGSSRETNIPEKLRYQSMRQVLTYDLAQQVALTLGFAPDETPLVETESGLVWFHWLGEVYGYILTMLLSGHVGLAQSSQLGLWLGVESEFSVPMWTISQINAYLENDYRKLELLLDLGAYHYLLPTHLRQRSVIEQFNVPRFLEVLNSIKLNCIKLQDVAETYDSRLLEIIK